MIYTKNPVEHVEAGERLALELLSGVDFPEIKMEWTQNGPFLPPTFVYVVGDQKFTQAQLIEAKKQVDWSRVQYVGQKIEMIDQKTADQ